MKLSTSEKVTLISTFGVAILTIIFHVGFRFYFQPDLRYELGSYYFHGENAVTYAKLKNYGNSDAEDIAFNVEFPTVLVDYSTDNPLINISTVSGGVGSKSFIGHIAAIRPGETLTIYFDVDNKEKINVKSDFLKKATFKNGVAKTGKPIWFGISVQVLIIVLLIVFQSVRTRKVADKHYERIEEILHIARDAKRDGLSEEDYVALIEDKIKDVSFRKEGLRLIAKSAFNVQNRTSI